MKTSQSQYAQTVPLARDGAYTQAAEIIQSAKNREYKEKDQVLYYLDLGMLYHWAGEYEQSNKLLTQAENAIEELFTKSISKGLTSGVLNDNALDYSGEDYEDIYLNVFKALNYIHLGNREAALVEIRRVRIKLDILDDKYSTLIEEYNAGGEAQLEYQSNRFHNDVLARYLGMLLYRAEREWDSARIDRELIDRAWQAQPHLYNFPKPELPESGAPPDGTARLNVLCFTGMSPVKLAETLYVRTGEDIVYFSITNQGNDYVTDLIGFDFLFIPGAEPGVHFKVQFPRLGSRRSDADRIVVKIDGRAVAEVPLIENMENIARETFLLKQPLTVGRTIVRATLKNISKEIGKAAMQENMDEENAWIGILAGLVADVAVDATENADLRISHFFPAAASAVEIPVEPGSAHLTVEYRNGNTLMATDDLGIQNFTSDGLNLIESYMLR